MPYTTRTWTAALLVISALSSTAPACIWDTDTLRDEMHISGTKDFDLITGQFAHHSAAYYRYRVRHTQALLRAKPKSADLRNDLAIAHLKLKQFDQAQKLLEALEREDPTVYRTLSNLGVLHKKRGDFKRAASYTARALKIKPEGHLGLGDYYLHMLRYRALSGTPSATFLGAPHTKWSRWESPKIDLERARSMVRADQHFADGVLVLGDALVAKGDLNLGLWAYVRARKLGHKNPAAIGKRIAWIFKHWKEAGSHAGASWGSKRKTLVAQIESALEAAGKWQEAFKTTEAALIAKATDAKASSVDFAAVEASLLQKKVKRFRPTAAKWGVLTDADGNRVHLRRNLAKGAEAKGARRAPAEEAPQRQARSLPKAARDAHLPLGDEAPREAHEVRPRGAQPRSAKQDERQSK